MDDLTDKYYSKAEDKFFIIKNRYSTSDESETYSTFLEFYQALNGNLTNANLLEFDFHGYNPKDFNLDGAKISSKIMQMLGTYDDYYYQLITKDENLKRDNLSCEAIELKREIPLDDIPRNNDLILYYISDLHIFHKLQKHCQSKNAINRFEIEAYLKEIIISLKNSLSEWSYHRKIIFVGDISCNFEIFKLFFKVYREEFWNDTFVILGNHELWDDFLTKNYSSLDEIINQYREFLKTLEINLLENQIYFPNGNAIMNENDLINMPTADLRNIFLRNGYAIFGGIGFAGLNNDFNYNHGIYFNAPINREEEIKRSNRVALLHKRLSEIAPDKKIFFVTHMPMNNWSTDPYQSNWFYLSGHTHKNYYLIDEKHHVYADNQIGYQNHHFTFKYVSITQEYNIFEDYADGIYEITRNEYLEFNNGIGNRDMRFFTLFDKLYLVKRERTYGFFFKPQDKNTLYLLEGGQKRLIPNQDIQYYYTHLANYTNSIKNYLNEYTACQKQIANLIKSFGGSGEIHGCIIDIDCYNHIYLNPFDAKLTPYFATDIQNKYVYSNIETLLKDKNQRLYLNYLNLPKDNPLVNLNSVSEIKNKPTFVAETDIYRISRIIKNLQYTLNFNLVRSWNDKVITNVSIENGKLLINELITPPPITTVKSKSIKRPIITLTEKEKQQRLQQRFEEYQKKVSYLTGGTIEVLKYINAHTYATYHCLKCNYIWEQNAKRFVYQCWNCSSQQQ